jgi:hypothetical protein
MPGNSSRKGLDRPQAPLTAPLSGDPNIRRTKSEKTALCQSLTKSLVQWEQIMYIHPR